jgi:hypothetical protein
MRNRALPADTTLEAMRVYVAALRKMGPGRRAQLTQKLTRDLWARLEAGVRHRHPEYADREVRLAAMRLRFGDDLFGRTFPGVTIRP